MKKKEIKLLLSIKTYYVQLEFSQFSPISAVFVMKVDTFALAAELSSSRFRLKISYVPLPTQSTRLNIYRGSACDHAWAR